MWNKYLFWGWLEGHSVEGETQLSDPEETQYLALEVSHSLFVEDDGGNYKLKRGGGVETDGVQGTLGRSHIIGILTGLEKSTILGGNSMEWEELL